MDGLALSRPYVMDAPLRRKTNVLPSVELGFCLLPGEPNGEIESPNVRT